MDISSNSIKFKVLYLKGLELMEKEKEYVVFTIAHWRIAIKLDFVIRVVRAVEITPLPKSTDVILGVINIQGNIVPVFNIRRLFGLPEREIELSDQFIIAEFSNKKAALVVDGVLDIISGSSEKLCTLDDVLGKCDFEAIAKLDDGLVVILDLEKILQTNNINEILALELD